MTTPLRERLEAARQRLAADRKEAQPAPPCNVLFLSDTHLGEYIKERSRIEFLKRAADTDRDLCDFLDYYGNHLVDGKPWRLIINGDFLDFLTVTVTPSAQAQERRPELELDEDEESYGLDNDEPKAIWKLERISERHPRAFAYLADFIGRGHYVDMLYGNHDAEFFWPGAKERFVRLLVDTFFGGETVPGHTEASFAARVRWHEWFYWEPGKFYVEHGNQYDDFSCFQFRLDPVLPFKPTNLDLPASHMVIRYFVNRLVGFQTHNKDNWTMGHFFIWLFRQGWSRMRFIASSYVLCTGRLLAYARRFRHADTQAIEVVHQQRLEQEAARHGLEPETLRKLDRLRSRPAHESLGRIIQAATLDQMALVLAFVASAVVVVLLPGWRLKLVALLLWLALLIGRKTLLRAARRRFLDGEVSTLVAPKLDAAAVRIAELLDVRYVVFGHSHKPMIRQVRDEPPGWYVNLGAWLPPRYRERHEGGCRSSLTFAQLLDRRVPELQLLRWCQRNDRPETFLAHLPAEADVPEETQLRTEQPPVAAAGASAPHSALPARRRRGKPAGRPSRESLRKQRY